MYTPWTLPKHVPRLHLISSVITAIRCQGSATRKKSRVAVSQLIAFWLLNYVLAAVGRPFGPSFMPDLSAIDLTEDSFHCVQVECCIRCLAQGVKATHIIDGRQPHSLLMELLTDEGVGTMIVGSARSASVTL